MYNPVATYRIQLHKEFTINDLDRILPYLQKLGVVTVYASPIFTAMPGSTHGYDGLNPSEINPEIGTEETLKTFSKKVREAGMGWLQDIVPNHMAFDVRNPWLMDVLEKGPLSAYATFFDIDWNSSIYEGRLMVPFLGASLEEVIQQGELKIAYENNRLVLKYFDNSYPLNPRSYATILQTGKARGNKAMQQWLEQMQPIKAIEDTKAYAEAWDEFLLQLAGLMKNTSVRTFIEKHITAINSQPEKIKQVADEQAYYLCHWQETDSRINFRRFFTVNGLICLNMQDEAVFQQYHQYIKTLIDEGIFQGLRIDHIDGLYDPTDYLERLRSLAGEESYIVVEKILEPGEHLPDHWPIQGNTGYDFLGMVNNLLTNKSNQKKFHQFYQSVVKEPFPFYQRLHDKKAFILNQHMGGELDNLYQLFMHLNLVPKRNLTTVHKEDLKMAIAEFLIQCPVYRYYGTHFPLQGAEATAVANLLNHMRGSGEAPLRAIAVLESVFLQKPEEGNEEYNKKVALFYQRCMQFAGPLMAKGVEDTLMYTYNLFIGHNEVGDAPDAFGSNAEEFHQQMQQRQEHWPLSLNATASHDTKRGEDVRARLNVLTDLADEWLHTVQEWQNLNSDLKKEGFPDANDEYFIYQSMVAAYPFYDSNEGEAFSSRIQEYLQKALREAKTHSNWTTPNEAYETATKAFAAGLLNKDRPFWQSFQQLQQKITDHGIVNSLAQVLLKFTCPGVPDVYQGCELWDLSFVDPDNRRPVNYHQRQQWLDELEAATEEEQQTVLKKLWQERTNAKIKLWLVYTLCNIRKQYPELFVQGEYLPLKVEGAYKEHVLAFARRHRQQFYIVAVPLHTALLTTEQQKDILELDWKDTAITLPDEIMGEWEHLLNKQKNKSDKGLPVADLFKYVPLALLKMRAVANERGAGILLHLTSLPAPFGIGDMGPAAKAFADFLYNSRQKYWQLLPLNPTEGGQGHSPYSAISSRAGNPLLISPEQLVKEGLLRAEELQPYYLPIESQANYAEAERVKKELFQKAYNAFASGKVPALQPDYQHFCNAEAEWLNDFALYSVLKEKFNGQPWYQWPDEYKLRKQSALDELSAQNETTLERIKWLQFIFSRQWHALKTYCNRRGIQLVGDLPFYISYDSADVWEHREIFALDENGERTGMAGVPPDAFSADGQLWGMPVFKWDVLKETDYSWWVDRLRKNMELFDLVRLDHFRAFADYWEVPAGAETAKSGEWKTGPGADFFNSVEKQLGELPFVAEDLGEITKEVTNLRDQFNLPGMKILQFAFGDDLPRSDYIPHNYTQNFIVYTGTHDNNTTRGWYNTEVDDATRLRVEAYVGRSLSAAEIHLELGRMAYASVAKIAILPLQDVLALDESARMNTPASGDNNWAWRLIPGQLTPADEDRLRRWSVMYNRE